MARRKKRIDPDDPTKALAGAMRRFDEDQGVVARRNARTDALGELRRLRDFIDAAYPVKNNEKPRRRKNRTQDKIAKDLVDAGWRITDALMRDTFARAGYPFRKSVGIRIFAPPWTVAVWEDVKHTRMRQRIREIRKVGKSKELRDATVTRHALKNANAA